MDRMKVVVVGGDAGSRGEVGFDLETEGNRP